MVEGNFKEKWYLSNITIGLVLFICSMVPFASILGIPLVVLKSYKYKNYVKNINEKYSQKEIEINKKLNDYKSENEQSLKKINELVLSLNNANGEIHRLKGLISPDAKKVESLKLQIEKLEIKANLLKEAVNKIEETKKELELSKKAIEKSKKESILKVKQEIREFTKIERAKSEMELQKLRDECEKLEQKIEENTIELIELDDEVLLQSFSLYKPQYDFVNSAQYKYKLDDIREDQKNMIRQDQAVLGDTNWTVNNDARKGKKMVNDTKKLLLRAFNSECEYVISKVRYNNFDTCLKRIKKASETISKLGVVMNISIHNRYYELKVQELRLALEYQQMKQREKEEQQELRARMREEARIQREIEAERKKAEKEKQHYLNALKEVQKQLAECTDETQRNALAEKLDEMQIQVSKIDKNLADIDYREANQRVGYVYVISNIGSFGENIYKIGMTRRLNPQERVDELGNASVPFNFDVHAMIFSKDAPALENALHHAFDDRKVNMVNKRREFFNVSLDEIEKVVKENFDGSVEFEKTALAEQYRESLKIKKEMSKCTA